MDHDIAIRLNDLDITRATEQTAIVMGWLLGRSIQSKNTNGKDSGNFRARHASKIEESAACSMLGYLADAYCSGRIIGSHVSDESKRTAKLVKLLPADHPTGRMPEDDRRGMQLDLLLSAVDGADDLREGRSGVISAVAGGGRGAFLKSSESQFLVLAIEPELAEIAARHRDGLDGTTLLEERVAQFFRQIIESSPDRKAEFEVGTIDKKDNLFRKSLWRLCRVRTFAGSPVAAAIAAYFSRSGVDAFIDVVSLTQARMIAIAAIVTQGMFLAMPVAAQNGTRSVESKGTFGGSEQFFADGADVFLDATGISDSLVLEGVRFLGGDRVSTHTLCLRTGTRSIRFVTHRHSLKEKSFRWLSEAGVNPDEFKHREVLRRLKLLRDESKSAG